MKGKVFVSVIAVLMMIMTCMVPAVQIGCSDAESAEITGDSPTGSEESMSVDDMLSILSEMKLSDLLDLLSLPDVDVPLELLPNMSTEEFLKMIEAILGGELSVRDAIIASEDSYIDRIASYARSLIVEVADKFGDAIGTILFSAITSGNDALDHRPISYPISERTEIEAGRSYEMSLGDSYIFSKSGCLVFKEGATLVTDGNFSIINNKDTGEGGNEIVLEAGSILKFCDYKHTVTADTIFDFDGRTDVKFKIGLDSVRNMNKRAITFGLSIDISDGGVIDITRKGSVTNFVSVGNDEKPGISVALNAIVTDAVLESITEGNMMALASCINDPDNEVTLDIEFFSLFGNTGMFSDQVIKVEFVGCGDEVDKEALRAEVDYTLWDGDSRIMDLTADVRFKQGDLQAEIDAVRDMTTTLIPFTGSLGLIIDFRDIMLINDEFGLDEAYFKIMADYRLDVDEGAVSFGFDVTDLLFDIGMTKYIRDNSEIITSTMPLVEVKVISEDFKLVIPVDIAQELSPWELIQESSYVNAYVYVGERNGDADVTVLFNSYGGGHCSLDINGKIDVDSDTITRVLELSSYDKDKVIHMEFNGVRFEIEDGEQTQSGDIIVEVKGDFQTNFIYNDDVPHHPKISIDTDMSVNLQTMESKGHAYIDGEFYLDKQIMSVGIIDLQGANSELYGNFDRFYVDFDQDEGIIIGGKINISFRIETYVDGEAIDFIAAGYDFEVGETSDEGRPIVAGIKNNFDKDPGHMVIIGNDFVMGGYKETKTVNAMGHELDYVSKYSNEDGIVDQRDEISFDRQIPFGRNNQGVIEVSVGDGNTPFYISDNEEGKYAQGYIDFSLVYGDPEVDEISVEKINFMTSLGGLYDDSITEAVTGMEFNVINLKVDDSVDLDTYINITVPRMSIGIDYNVETRLPTYTYTGTADFDIQLNNVHTKTEIDLSEGFTVKATDIDIEGNYLNDVSGSGSMRSDVYIYSKSSDNRVFKIDTKNMLIAVVLEGQMIGSDGMQIIDLFREGSRFSANSVSIETVTGEHSNIELDNPYLSFFWDGNGNVVLDIGRADNYGKVSNSAMIDTTNFTISGRNVSSLVVSAKNAFAHVMIDGDEFHRMLFSEKFDIMSLRLGTKVFFDSFTIGLSISKDDRSSVSIVGADITYLDAGNFRFSFKADLFSDGLSLDYPGEDGTANHIETKGAEVRTIHNGTLNLSNILKGVNVTTYNLLIGSSGLSETNFDSDRGMSGKISATSGDRTKIGFNASNLKFKGTFNGFIDSIENIDSWRLKDVGLFAQGLDLDLKLPDVMAVSGTATGVDVTVSLDGKVFEVKFGAEFVDGTANVVSESYANGKRQVGVKAASVDGDAKVDIYSLIRDYKDGRIDVILEFGGQSADVTVNGVMRIAGTSFSVKTDAVGNGAYTFVRGSYEFENVLSPFPLYFKSGTSARFSGCNLGDTTFDNANILSGSVSVGGKDISAYYPKGITFACGSDVSIFIPSVKNVGSDEWEINELIVGDLAAKSFEIRPITGHEILTCIDGLDYTVIDENHAKLNEFKGKLSINTERARFSIRCGDSEPINRAYGTVVEFPLSKYHPIDMTLYSESAAQFISSDGRMYRMVGLYDGHDIIKPTDGKVTYKMPANNTTVLEYVMAEEIDKDYLKGGNTYETENTSVYLSKSASVSGSLQGNEKLSLKMKDATVRVDKGFLSAFEKDLSISVNKVELTGQMAKTLGDALCFDIDVSHNGSDVGTFDKGKFEVLVEIPSEWNDSKIRAYCIDNNEMEIIEVGVTVEGGRHYAVLSLPHFSKYAVDDKGTDVQDQHPNVTPEKPDNGGDKPADDGGKDSGSGMFLYVGIGAGALVLIGIIVFLIMRKH